MSGLLTVSEVADYLKTTTTTIYRWLKEGTLTASKIGKEWRIDEAQLKALISRNNNTAGSSSYFWQYLRENEHIILITNKNSEITQFEAEFFNKGLSEGAMLMKGCWWQDENEVVEQYMKNGLDAASLIKNGILSVINLSELYKKEGIEGPVRAWRSSIDRAVSRGVARLWASGSPNMNCCGNDPGLVLAFEAKLNDTIKSAPVVGVCPYSLENESNRVYFEKIISMMNHHSGVAFYCNEQYSLLRH